jgi:hypothetical protein
MQATGQPGNLQCPSPLARRTLGEGEYIESTRRHAIAKVTLGTWRLTPR